MTLVVWDGKTLAADRLVSTRFSGREEMSESIKFIEATKIHSFPDEEFLFTENGPRLLAIGYSGHKSDIEHFHEHMFFSDVFGKIPLSAKIKKYRQLRGNVIASSLSIYSSKGRDGESIINHLVVSPSSINAPTKLSKIDTKAGDVVSIGSGSGLADSFSKLGKLGSDEIIRLVSLFSSSVGNGINYVTPEKSLKLIRSDSYGSKEKEKHIKLFSKFISEGSIFKEKK